MLESILSAEVAPKPLVGEQPYDWAFLTEEEHTALQLSSALSDHQDLVSVELNRYVAGKLLQQTLLYERTTETTQKYDLDVPKFLRYLQQIKHPLFEDEGECD